MAPRHDIALFFAGYLPNHTDPDSADLNAGRSTIKPFEFNSPVYTIKENPASIRTDA
jgi:hypothetical protein